MVLGRHHDGLGEAGADLVEEPPSLAEGLAAEVPVVEGQQVEGHEVRGRRLGQHRHAGLGRVDALAEQIEVETLGPGHDQLAVDDAAVGKVCPQRCRHLGEVPGERLLVAAPELDLVAVAEHDAAKSVPLRLEHEGAVVAVWQGMDGLGQHRLHGWHHGQIHTAARYRCLVKPAVPPKSGTCASRCPAQVPDFGEEVGCGDSSLPAHPGGEPPMATTDDTTADGSSPGTDAIEPFTIAAPDADLDDLRSRLANARWPEAETVDDWSQGIPLAYTQELAEYWASSYDWRAREAALNRFDHYRTTIDGLGIHFIHARSPHPDAFPLVITHGWPGSVVEFHKVIEPLTDPTAHGGDAADAFDVVCPSLPGYGFSDKPAETGWGVAKIAAAWDQLMVRLGYPRYGAQGGDWGSAVTTKIGENHGDRCAAIHLNMPLGRPTEEATTNPGPADLNAFERLTYYQEQDSGYSKQQSTRPQTLGYGLVDSPVGQMAWIVEKFWSWMDCDGHPETILTKDELLDNVMLYWLTASGASSARLYWESFNDFGGGTVEIPTGCAAFPAEILPTPRAWAEQRYHIVHWTDMPKGGHFAAFEQPDLFVDDLRLFFRQFR